MRKKFAFLITLFLSLFIAVSGSVLAAEYTLKNRVFPGTRVGFLDVSLKTVEETQSSIQNLLESQSPLNFQYQGKVISVPLQDIGVELKTVDEIFDEIAFFHPTRPLQFYQRAFRTQHVSLLKQVDFDTLEGFFSQTFSDLGVFPKNASFSLDAKGKVHIEPESSGKIVDKEALLSLLQRIGENSEKMTIEIPSTTLVPSIRAGDLEPERPLLEEKLRSQLILSYKEQSWKFDVQKYLEVFTVDVEEYLDLDSQQISLDTVSMVKARLKIDSEKFSDAVATMFEGFEIEPQDVKIFKEDDRIRLEGTAQNGKKIDRGALVSALEMAVNERVSEIDLPVMEMKGRVDVPLEFLELGIRELVATGYSNFKGSPDNRIHNIKTGISKFNGVLIGPGEEFSFNQYLGEVSDSTGYKKELVIREGNTIPEYGGGLCQVSSTAFRAALFGGFPITARRPHSYAVVYYARPLGYGLDATIYPPYTDLKFRNDTQGSLLIQAYTEGFDAYFKFYGTSDNREVRLDGPYTDNTVEPPSDVIVYTTELPPGEKKKVDSSHAGFDATWYRTVTKDGVISEKETFFSRYKAWPNKYLVGFE